MKKSYLNKYRHIIFSPHLDDGVLSCGGLIQKFPNQVLVVNIFTSKGKSDGSRYAKKYVDFCGFRRPEEYFSQRKREEKNVADFLDYDQISLDFPEAFFRYKTRLFLKRYFYKEKRHLSGEIDREDYILVDQLRLKLEKIVNRYAHKGTKIYFPLSIGNHVDHQIVNLAGQKLRNRWSVIFYEDFPYKLASKSAGLTRDKMSKQEVKLSKRQLEKKYQAIIMYKSQIKPLFGSLTEFIKKWERVTADGKEIYWS